MARKSQSLHTTAILDYLKQQSLLVCVDICQHFGCLFGRALHDRELESLDIKTLTELRRQGLITVAYIELHGMIYADISLALTEVPDA